MVMGLIWNINVISETIDVELYIFRPVFHINLAVYMLIPDIRQTFCVLVEIDTIKSNLLKMNLYIYS